MAIDFGQLRSTKDVNPPICTFYAGAKSGKTTLASEWPAPYYCRTGEGENAPRGVEMFSFGVSETYQDVLDQCDWMLEAEHECRTFLLDSLDGLEQLIRKHACAINGWADIETPGFGKGYAAELGIWHEFMAKILTLKSKGFYTVLIAHVKTKTVPGVTTDSYPQYMPNLRDDAIGVIVDASDLIGFLHPRVSVTKEELGFKKIAKRGAGGNEILIAVNKQPGFIAGNRLRISKPTLPFKEGEGFKVLSQYFPDVDLPANDDEPDEQDQEDAA